MKKNNFGQFYTNPLTAKKLTSIFLEKLNYQTKSATAKITFIEPSAGTGNFCQVIKELTKNNSWISKKILAFDLEPKSNQENVIKTNFLTPN